LDQEGDSGVDYFGLPYFDAGVQDLLDAAVEARLVYRGSELKKTPSSSFASYPSGMILHYFPGILSKG
jgi:hypothetical protein